MKKLYLLAFTRHGADLPCEAPLWVKCTTVGEYSVLWCNSPKETFSSKRDFLYAMLQWYERINELNLTILPIQAGVITFSEINLIELLNKYAKELEACFAKVDGCSEYCLILAHKERDSAQFPNLPDKENVQSGKEYLNRLRVRHEFLAREVARTRELVEDLRSSLTPLIKDSWFEVPKTIESGINLSFLVPNSLRGVFIHKLESLADNCDWTIDYSGPWPPFHFSSLSLKSEKYLIRESSQWVNREVIS
ncbi:GvpL/GvpF family gas vesicle protein [Desulfosporosinus sp. FKB]|uniref:GvpL/GvpF family gas vesicle protein n=1 Tax=Desulfosporosinus sp. FKB TaxID=1969835 RepID=UPI000B4A277E|nr:GvpL/GvpF family gas vesicle protein [Desulfosporosinus sp. FKB]